MEIRKRTVSMQTVAALLLIVAGVLFRLVPHVPNFAPIGAIALFAGAVLHWRLAVWLPLLIMGISDMVLGFYPGIAYTWAAFLLVVVLGMVLRKYATLWRIAFGGLGGAFLFFVVSNMGVWVASGMYPHTAAGLTDCFVAALPFFRMTLLSDIFFSAVLFGMYELAARRFAGNVSVSAS